MLIKFKYLPHASDIFTDIIIDAASGAVSSKGQNSHQSASNNCFEMTVLNTHSWREYVHQRSVHLSTDVVAKGPSDDLICL